MIESTSNRIEDEEELLRLYYHAQRSVLHERSGSIEEDIAKLHIRVLDYAVRKRLPYPDYISWP